MSEADAPPAASCQACADAPRVQPPSAMTQVPRLATRGDVEGFPGLTSRTDVTHAVDKGAILAQYGEIGWIQCSLPYRHLHEQGVIVRTRCGLILKMGLVCGKKWAVGLDGARKYAVDVDKHFANLALLQEMSGKLSDLERAATWILKAKSEMSLVLHEPVVRELENRVGRYSEVGGNGKRRTDVWVGDAEREIRGLDVFASDAPTAAWFDGLRATLRETEPLQLRAAVLSAKSKLEKLEAFVRAGREFFTPANVETVGVASGVSLELNNGYMVWNRRGYSAAWVRSHRGEAHAQDMATMFIGSIEQKEAA